MAISACSMPFYDIEYTPLFSGDCPWLPMATNPVARAIIIA
jgi:hypothetical protein